MQTMTYARMKAARPATAAKPNDAWTPAAEPVNWVGVAVAEGLVTFFGGWMYPVELGAGTGATGTVGATVTVL